MSEGLAFNDKRTPWKQNIQKSATLKIRFAVQYKKSRMYVFAEKFIKYLPAYVWKFLFYSFVENAF